MRKGIIFDLDGTLLDSMQMWGHVAENYLKTKGIIDTNIDDECVEFSIEESSEWIKKKHNLEEQASLIRLELNCYIEEEYFHKLILKDGVMDFLEYAKSKGFKMIIATATPRPLVIAALKRNHVLDYFMDVITTMTVKKSKNYPDIYDYCLKVMNLEKKDVLVFEDIKHAINTLNKASYTVVGVKDINNDYIYSICEYTIDSYLEESTYKLIEKII